MNLILIRAVQRNSNILVWFRWVKGFRVMTRNVIKSIFPMSWSITWVYWNLIAHFECMRMFSVGFMYYFSFHYCNTLNNIELMFTLFAADLNENQKKLWKHQVIKFKEGIGKHSKQHWKGKKYMCEPRIRHSQVQVCGKLADWERSICNRGC